MLSIKGNNCCLFYFSLFRYDLHLPTMSETMTSVLEWVVLGLNVVFLLLLIRENIWCWIFGIVASLISVVLFFEAKLYSETLLYSVYVVLGIYAWIQWHTNSKKTPMPIQTKSLVFHGKALVICFLVWFGLGFFFKTYTDSNLPWADACSLSFAFVATYLEAKKVLHHWIYWIGVNVFSIWLYHTRSLPVLALMMFGFTIFSVVGYIAWQKRLKLQATV